MKTLYGYLSYPCESAPLISQVQLTNELKPLSAEIDSPEFEFTSATKLFLTVRSHDIVIRPTGRDMAAKDYSIWMAKHDLSFWGKESE